MSGNAIIAGWGMAMIAALLLGGFLAQWKNRDWSFWAAWCFLLPPAVIILALLPKLKGPRPRRRTLDEDDRHADHA